MANITQTFPAGAGGGHTILDSTGTAVAQEKNLKITGLDVTDNPTDESTDLAPAGLNQDSLDDVAGTSLPGTTLVGSGFNYSESEQIIGRWVDGKPIYQKTITNLSLAFTWSSQYHTTTPVISPLISDVDKIINCIIYSQSPWRAMPISATVRTDGNWVFVGINDFTANIVTLQYTKTTD